MLNIGPKIVTETPIDSFNTLFSDELVELLVVQTNIYATLKALGPIRFPTNSKEMRVFLGLNLCMGIKKLPYYRDYWSAQPELRDSYISKHMSVNRFGWLLTHLHVNDNSVMLNRGDPNYDKLYKVRPLLDSHSKTYKYSYNPTREQSVDESMIKFKGRSSLKQYMPDKPIKRGYKVWTRADAHGYVCQFQVYESKKDNKRELDLGRIVVKD